VVLVQWCRFRVRTVVQRGVPKVEQDGGLFSLGMTDSSVEMSNAAQTSAPKYVCDTLKLNILVEDGFLFESLLGVRRG